MTCSPARLAANRQNALLSTGPKTPEGKARSRANSLKHGLCAAVVVPEDLEMVQARTDCWYYTLKPQTEYHAWLVDKIAIASLRIDRCERMERRLRDRKSMVAEVAWEDERRLEAEVLGGKIARSPAEVVERLRQSPCGCDWLISRWSMLARVAEVNEGWTPDQVTLAFHLLGTPLELREGLKPGDSLDHDGRVVESVDDRVTFARGQSAALRERREAVTDRDEVDQALTEADLFDDAHPELKRLQRHETMLHTRLRWCLAQLKYESPHLRPHPDLKPTWRMKMELETEAEPKPEQTPALEVAPAPAPSLAPDSEPDPKAKKVKFEFWMAKPPHPPFDLEPEEIPEDHATIDIGAIAIAREVKRLKKFEDRREVRRRRLERMRA